MLSPSASELIDRLYQLADDPLHWPVLVSTLLDVMDRSSNDVDLTEDGDSQRFMAWLTPHVLRVLALHDKELLHAARDDFLAAYVDQQPVAMALCDQQGRVRWASRQLAELLERLPPQVVSQFLQSNAKRPSLHKLPAADTVSTGATVVLVDVPALGPNFCALLMSTGAPVDLDALQLASLYGLTPAEVSITTMLAQGMNTEDIARANDTAVATVRSQIKKAMSKLGVSRQAELVAVLHNHTARVHFGDSPLTHARSIPHSVLNYKGHKIAYNLVGPSDGLPVFFFHSWAGSRLQAMQSSECLYQNGVRLVTFDRIGCGGSTRSNQAPVLTLPELVTALADHLKLTKFTLLGYSLGAHYALQSAAALPHRVHRVFLVCPVSPVRGFSDLKGILPSGKLLMGLAMKAPTLARAMVRLWMAQTRRTPALYLQSVLPHLPPSDLAAMQAPQEQAAYVASLNEGIRQGDDALLEELDVMVQDWQHHLDVHQPTVMWHGLQDCHVPFTNAQRLASEMTNAELRGVPNAGHFLMFHHWHEIMAELRLSTLESASA